MPAHPPLTRADFPGLTPVAQPAPVTEIPVRSWTADEWTRIRQGYQARDMDEKWHVFAEGDTLHLHRSWTGRGVYEVTFTADSDVPGEHRISAAVVDDPGDRGPHFAGAYDRIMIELVISSVVLGEPAAELRAELVRWAQATEPDREIPGGLLLHSLVGQRTAD